MLLQEFARNILKATAKDLHIGPIKAYDANRIIRHLHYSGKVYPKSKLHLGVFLNGKCGGALSFGPSMDVRKTMGIVAGTKWNDFIELNRMALADWLPRNGESRAISVSMKIIKKKYPNIKWVLSYADATQCGDGIIYRASGFVLTGIKKNKTMWKLPSGEVIADIITRARWNNTTRDRLGFRLGESFKTFKDRCGAELLEGFQLRYIYFLDKSCRKKLTVPEIPYSEIKSLGAKMYKGRAVA